MGLNLEELKTRVKDVSLGHKLIKSFDFGENFDVATNDRISTYPKVFLELPYLINYENSRRFKTIRFAIMVFNTAKFDHNTESHEVISTMETTAEAIISKLEVSYTDFKFDSVDLTSIRDFSDDNLAGVRVEVVVRTQRTFCNPPSYLDEFDC